MSVLDPISDQLVRIVRTEMDVKVCEWCQEDVVRSSVSGFAFREKGLKA